MMREEICLVGSSDDDEFDMIDAVFADVEYMATVELPLEYRHKHCVMFGDRVCASTDTLEEAVTLQTTQFRGLVTFVRRPMPVAEVPVAEVPVAEVPVAEVPVVEVPVVEVPVAEVPVVEVPVVEVPVRCI
jgi:hypothetical protein